MPRKLRDIPEEGEIVMATVERVEDHGAFVTLDEYPGVDGYIHISEVASGWVKNIGDYVKEGQKVVAKVIRVNPKRKYANLSLRKVTDHQRKEKLKEWKREQRAEKLLEMVAEELGKDLDEAYEEAGYKLIEEYGSLYDALERAAAEEGPEPLLKAGIPEEWAEKLAELAIENIEPGRVKIEAYVDLTCPAPNGVEIIREALEKIEEFQQGDVKMEVQYVGAPRYRITVDAPDYRTAEKMVRKAAQAAIDHVEEHGGEGEFHREIEEG
ncbi:translation initiation factor IF-2 subunit alpha [Methanopyrus sp. SNP6]|uniref:translation initiation factor IF-2 subunit alpha n=1 Tax=Methanopyrus sp. SNP6 TaxID=1937005 RepID=UPI0011E59EA3|nr:translation initiation factor IF-2 subunit alpha [Methanopyrus sp. SNP6]